MRRLRWLVPSLALAVLLPTSSGHAVSEPSATQRVTFTFVGRGWGHGVGMSQWGAYGRARAGWKAPRILRHYYRGAKLSRAPGTAMRVLLAERRRRVAVSSARTIVVIDEGSGRRRRYRPQTVLTVQIRDDGELVLTPRGDRGIRFSGSARFEVAPSGSIVWGGRKPDAARRYRGRLRVARDGSRRLRVINIVGLEAYLRGVVPREMPARWGDDGPAALRAQAVAARSYALATRRRGDDFDAYDDVRSQVYGGAVAEDPRTDAAVAATRRQVMTHQGRVATTFFFSTSGGRTEDAGNVFGTSAPYLRSVSDGFDRGSPYHRWPDRPTFSAVELGERLGVGAPVAALTVVRRGRSPRVIEAIAVTKAGERRILRGVEIRRALDLRDTWFRVVRKTEEASRS